MTRGKRRGRNKLMINKIGEVGEEMRRGQTSMTSNKVRIIFESNQSRIRSGWVASYPL